MRNWWLVERDADTARHLHALERHRGTTELNFWRDIRTAPRAPEGKDMVTPAFKTF